MFNFDETNIQLTPNARKFFTRRGQKRANALKQLDTSHIKADCCVSQAGIKVPLFIILNNIKSCPNAHSQYINHPDVWLSSQKSGWMTKKLFYEWCKLFTNWLSENRKFFPPHYATETVTLILDSHKSITSVQAMTLLNLCEVRVITFPPNSTHLLQPFDVTIARELKSLFSRYCRQYFEEYLDEYSAKRNLIGIQS